MNDDINSQVSRRLLNFAATATIIIIIVGLIGNSLTIYILLRVKKLQTSTAAFLASLVTSGIIYCILVLPFEVSKYIHGSWDPDRYLCSLVPIFRYGSVATSLSSLTMISVNRYLQIAHIHFYVKFCSKKCDLIFMIALSWIVSYGLTLLIFFKLWGQFGYDSLIGSCTIKPDQYGRSPKKFLFLASFVLPFVIIVYCYTRIYMIVRQSNARVLQYGHGLSTSKKLNSLKLVRMVLCIFFAFVICYLPLTILKIVDSSVQHSTLHILAYILNYLSSCINPIIYVLLNQEYRKAYAQSICSCVRLRNAFSTNVYEINNTGDVQINHKAITLVAYNMAPAERQGALGPFYKTSAGAYRFQLQLHTRLGFHASPWERKIII